MTEPINHHCESLVLID